MDFPPGFETESTINKVCNLRKSFYGLKQLPRAWFHRFSNVLKKNDYIQGQFDHTLFVKQSEGRKITVLVVYVDIVLTGRCNEEMFHVKSLLKKEFEIKDLGYLKYFLGKEVARSSMGKYVLDLLKETRMLGCKPVFWKKLECWGANK